MRGLLAILCILLAPAWARGDEITLRPTVRLAAGGDATLADIATLSGAGAETLGDTIVVPAAELGTGWIRVDVERVRGALESRGPVPWGVISLRGSACSVGVSAPGPAAPAAGAIPPPKAHEDARAIGPDTVKGRIAAKIVGALGVPAERVRFDFDERDSDILAMPVSGRTIEARLTGESDRMPVRLTVFEGERLLVSRSLSVGVTVRRDVAAASKAIRRGETISEGEFRVEERWVGPSLRALAPGDAGGNSAKAAISEGQVLTVGDVEAPLVIKRGDLVTVSSIAGGVIVRTTARARGSARDGEIVALETLDADRKRRRAFSARACGRGQAVVATSAGDGDTENLP